MKKLIFPIITLFVCFLLIRQVPSIIASSADLEFIPYNASLEGAKILHHRNKVRYDDGRNYDFILAGTSRTMSDYSPSIISKELAASCSIQKELKGWNLGNIANDYAEFEEMLPHLSNHKLLLLEFSPHMVLGQSEEDSNRLDLHFFNNYRRVINEWETRLTGYFKKLISFEERFVFNPRIIRAVYNYFIRDSISLQRMFILNRMNTGYGQRLQEDGQVHYYTFIPDEKVGKTIREKRAEYNSYKNRTLSKPFSPERLEALERIIKIKEENLIVIRPPIDSELYELENQMAKNQITKVQNLLHHYRIPYIDMNPHPWYSTDMSHIDWYDTPRASKELAAKLFPILKEDTLCRTR